ncbi:MAG: TonB-dependent receptor [Candidatus Omnitrophica bacterium]|nr:TonB-dependent receptor [Candidatus Omnitrophota bacterium]
MKKKILVLVGILILLTTNRIWAEAEEKLIAKYDLGEVIVTATKTEQYQAEVGSSTTVITEKEIERKGKMTVVELLRGVPGISVTQQGGIGSFTQLYLRGGAPGYTMVMIDGMEVKYLMEHDGGFFDFAHLTTDNIERIEIIRGPQSTLYGSSAMSGVINIITKKGEGKPKFNFSFEGGSHNTFRELFGLSGSAEKINYSFSLSRVDSDGISSAAGGAEKDGCEISTISSRLGFKVFDDSQLSLVLRYTDAETNLDDSWPSPHDDSNYITEKRMFSSKVQFDQSLADWWDHKISFSYLDTERIYKDFSDDVDSSDNTHNWYNGDMKKIEWQHNFYPVEFDTITTGFEYKEERGFGDGYASGSARFDRKTIDNKAYYVQNQLELWENFFTTVGFRIDDHQLFGTETTYKISSAYLISETGTKLKANWGTGFKAPSLYQLYSSYGDSNLKPEESKNYDFGFEQSAFNGRVSFGATYFHNDFEQMIGGTYTIPGDWTSYKYANIDKVETRGVEIEAFVKPVENLTISVNHTFLDAENETSGLELTRRPKNKSNFAINYGFFDKGNINLGITRVGHRWVNSANTQKMKPYIKVDLAASYDFTENFQLFGRIENLFDKKYQEVDGYATPGASFYAGVKASF